MKVSLKAGQPFLERGQPDPVFFECSKRTPLVPVSTVATSTGKARWDVGWGRKVREAFAVALWWQVGLLTESLAR